nr:cupin domain-containing protein [Caballeronia sp. EK]
MTIAHAGSQPSLPGGSQRFVGSVRIDPLFQSTSPSRLSGGMVTFEPGARTAWHTHPLGQTLIVMSGTGWIRQWSQERREIVAGDIVSIPAGVKHWHGATSTAGMTHIALQEALDGKNVDWLEQVTDEQYRYP